MSTEKQDIEILSQLIDDEQGNYRVRVGQIVRYITISSGVFDDDTMCHPNALIPRLPDLPVGTWTTMHISRDNATGSLVWSISTDPLPEIKTLWHPRRVEVLTLTKTRRFRSGVHEVQCRLDDSSLTHGDVAVAKIACFSWDIGRMERETWAYSVLAKVEGDTNRATGQKPADSVGNIIPRFLGHITENGRPIGLLLEKLDGKAANISDLTDCEAVIRQLHHAGLIHGDVNRYNFVVDRHVGGKRIHLVDFEHASVYDEEAARAELLSLPVELAEETGRGGLYKEVTIDELIKCALIDSDGEGDVKL